MARTCKECGGTRDGADGRLVVRGCPGCCRDCGFPCDREKDAEGFHVVAIDAEYLEARRLAESVDHERVALVLTPERIAARDAICHEVDAQECEGCGKPIPVGVGVAEDPEWFIDSETVVEAGEPVEYATIRCPECW